MTSAPFPVVLQASQVQFAPAERLAFPRVESRMVLLCRAGSGTVCVDGHDYAVAEGSALVLPWGHSISYTASAADPFLVGGAHLVAEHDEGRPVRPTIPHDPRHELAGCGWRRDGRGLGGDDVVATSAAEHPELVGVAVYAIELFTPQPPPTTVLRALGTLLAHELASLTKPRGSAYASGLPPEVRKVVAYVDAHLDAVLSVRAMAEVAGCSEATLTRRFRTCLGQSPLRWLTARRLARAAELLRSTSLPVAQVARRCGVADPYYFSRLFRAHHGESPTSWRRGQHVL